MNTLTQASLALLIAATCACTDDYAPNSDMACRDCQDDLPTPEPTPAPAPDGEPDDFEDSCPEGQPLDLVVRSATVRGKIELDIEGRGGARPEWARFAQIIAVNTLQPPNHSSGVDQNGEYEIELLEI